MSNFTIRVVLHDKATWDEYSTLREQLAIQGVVDYIESTDGRWWRLPPAEYTYTGTETGEIVRTVVKRIASGIKANNAVLVSISTERLWDGLEVLKGPG